MKRIEPLPLVTILVTAFTFSFIFVVVSPLTIYLENSSEFAIGITELIIVLAISLAGMTAVLAAVMLLLRKSIAGVVVAALLLGLGAMCWVQSQVFTWKFGPLDGRGINWSSWRPEMALEIVVWLLVVATTLWFVVRRRRLRLIMPAAICALGVMSIVIAWSSNTYRTTQLSTNDTYFVFNPDTNRVIIVLDTFQSDIFEDIMHKWPNETSFLTGFTYYPNTLGGYPTTIASVPLMLTGKYYKNEVPIKEWTASQNKDNVGHFLANKGFGVSYATWAYAVVAGSEGPIGDLLSLSSAGGSAELSVHVIDAGVFRLIPTILKPYYYNKGSWFLTRLLFRDASHDPPGFHGVDSRFVRAFSRAAHVVTDSKPQFKFFHFSGAHPPYVLDAHHELAVSTDQLSARQLRIRQSRGVLLMLKQFLATFKKLGIYDSAQILVVGDHGSDVAADDWISQPVKPMMKLAWLGSARPLFLYKPAGAAAPLTVSDAPRDLANIPCLVTEGAFDGYPGIAACTENKTRKFYFYHWGAKYWNWSQKYLPPMDEYDVRGDVRVGASWTYAGIRYTNAGRQVLPGPPKYQVGSVVSFASGGNAEDFLVAGWSHQEKSFRWTDGPRADVLLDFRNPPAGGVELLVHFIPFVNAKNPRQVIGVSVNGHHVAEWNASKPGVYTARIPNDVIRSEQANIVFHIGDPARPCDFGNSTDCRKLGMAVSSLQVVPLRNTHDDAAMSNKHGL